MDIGAVSKGKGKGKGKGHLPDCLLLTLPCCYICGRPGHLARDCYYNPERYYQYYEANAKNQNEEYFDEHGRRWVVATFGDTAVEPRATTTPTMATVTASASKPPPPLSVPRTTASSSASHRPIKSYSIDEPIESYCLGAILKEDNSSKDTFDDKTHNEIHKMKEQVNDLKKVTDELKKMVFDIKGIKTNSEIFGNAVNEIKEMVIEMQSDFEDFGKQRLSRQCL